ncbi:hypothetical protein CR205_11870 [Alteribacter lacisalsi]|uniref:Uncharacterized protein n=1 Tax=Alteribacter lacisalsi TaxID=2045244 RepID=A0A2W0H3L2_9BACI|nr:hypothetical protein [Alteribacter lacisalsi]PYZ96414.1 hypothetical protein CR205_11870 [Alteribacter lacisalsi]
MKQPANTLKRFILDRLKLEKIPELNLTTGELKEFEQIYEAHIAGVNGEHFTYQSEVPLYRFLNYVLEQKNVVVHGSNSSTIREFEPRDSTLFTGKPVSAVFASTDGVWSLFFAVKKRAGYTGSLRNLCLTVPGKRGIRRYYYFSVNRDQLKDCWTDGMIYFLPKDTFRPGGIRDEWVSEEPVKPLAAVQVSPADFPLIEQVRHHSEADSMMKTLLQAAFVRKK